MWDTALHEGTLRISALGQVQFVQRLGMQHGDFPNPPALTQQLHLSFHCKDFVSVQL